MIASASEAIQECRRRDSLEAALDRAIKGEDMKQLIADFNRDWPDVTRTRDTFVLAEKFAG